MHPITQSKRTNHVNSWSVIIFTAPERILAVRLAVANIFFSKSAGVVLKEPLFKTPQLFKIRTAKEHSDGVVAQADGVDDRNTAELLKNCRIFIARSSFPTAKKDEFYWVDLMGREVINREGVMIGSVKDLISTGPNTVIVAEREVEGKALETLIPFVGAYVDTVSLEDKRIAVDWQLDY